MAHDDAAPTELALNGREPKVAMSKGSEVDAFLVARLRQYPDALAADEEMSRERVYTGWLIESCR